MTAREIKTSDKLIALGLALCATVMGVLALAAPAKAETYSNGFKMSKFKVEIKGWQKMVQQYSHLSENECDPDIFTSGSERVDFETTKPIVITATYFPKEFNPSFFSGKLLGIPTKAKVKRSYTPRIYFPGPGLNCGDNGGGVETVYEPDCGTKTVQPFVVTLQFSERKKNHMLLAGDTDGDPFERCPGAADQSFPWLIHQNTKGKEIFADLSQDDLFNPKFGKWISIATGKRKVRYKDHWVETEVRWEVSFTRLQNK